MRQHAKAGEAEACGAIAHSLKSMSLNIGAVEVAKMAGAFEQAARGDGRVPDQNEIVALAGALERALAALAHETGETGTDQRLPATDDVPPSATVPSGSIEEDLHHAIERGELDVAYQPIVDRASKQVLGVEALLRWRRGGTDNVPPSEFVPIAERTGCIDQIGEWVLRRACADALAWPETHRCREHIGNSISPGEPGGSHRTNSVGSGHRPISYRA